MALGFSQDSQVDHDHLSPSPPVQMGSEMVIACNGGKNEAEILWNAGKSPPQKLGVMKVGVEEDVSRPTLK